MKKFNIRIKLVAIDYYTIEAESWEEAEKKAEEELLLLIREDIPYTLDFEEFDPADQDFSDAHFVYSTEG